ncbi:DUF4932 domain-containing protein [Spirosoma linguale]|uniref:DUF4932 domain-containing protein n=1 Tax=Spirosoma linguale (strain ATCC 33905 / DSM 74 / LMG 10896 / Claus 1) TaxID=504472 RepID=D2QVU3_SPILD|nr:hypothetical protein Slin_6981 [Spirosoma linguale DSM 74]
MKTTSIKLLFTCFLLLLSPKLAFSSTTNPTGHFQVFQTQIKGVTYSVDPRIELFQTVMLLAGNPQINGADLDYKLLIATYFEPYQQHALFGFIKKYAPQGKLFTTIDGPIWFMLHLTPQLEWRKDLPNPYHQQPLLDSLRILVKQFARDSHYADFFNSNAEFYRLSLANLTFNLAGQDEKTRLLAYYGATNPQRIQFHVVLNFLGYGHFGPRLETARSKEFYAIIAPNGGHDGLPTFNQKDLYGLLWHEFGHSFANPLIEENLAQFETMSSLWEPIKVSMQVQAYAEWKAVLWEHLVNAVMCRLAAQKQGEAYAQLIYVRPLLGRRWIYLHPLLEALKDYEANRKSYPTLRSFMPRIIQAFTHIQPGHIEQWQQQTNFIRQPDVALLPNLEAIYGQSNVLFILATGEVDRSGHDRLKAYVKAHQLEHFPTATLMDDTVALKMDLSAYNLFVVGTPWGNRYLQKVLPQIPINLTTDGIIVGKKYEGQGYAFLTSWVNPSNPQQVMTIYTAQKPDDLVNFATIPRGGSHYHLVKRLITVKGENYQRSGLVWNCP